MSETMRSSAPPPQPHYVEEKPHPDAVVYLVQEPTIPKAGGRVLDTTPLLWWGKVRILMERTQVASFRPAASLIQMHTRLTDFRPDKDYIAVAGGDSLAIALVGAILVQNGHSYFKWLRFERSKLPNGMRDPSSGSYVPIIVPLTVQAAVAQT